MKKGAFVFVFLYLSSSFCGVSCYNIAEVWSSKAVVCVLPEALLAPGADSAAIAREFEGCASLHSKIDRGT